MIILRDDLQKFNINHKGLKYYHNVQKILLIPTDVKLLPFNYYTTKYKLYVKIKNLKCI